MKTQEAMEQLRARLLLKYPAYWEFKAPERALLAMAELVNAVRVREKTGKNDGEWVGAILGAVELGQGYPWCAAAVEFCCDVAKLSEGPSDRASAAVVNWRNWAKSEGRIRTDPKRGYLCYWVNDNGTGHIGFVAGTVHPNKVRSLEGNTSPGDSGSQRDGQGAYERRRNKSVWDGFITLEEL
jgi:hypothetical protein